VFIEFFHFDSHATIILAYNFYIIIMLEKISYLNDMRFLVNSLLSVYYCRYSGKLMISLYFCQSKGSFKSNLVIIIQIIISDLLNLALILVLNHQWSSGRHPESGAGLCLLGRSIWYRKE
jgi:hypothetical protein